MKRLLIPVVVMVLGLLVGAAVSGLPTTVANDISVDQIRTVESTTALVETPESASTEPTTSPSTTDRP